MAVPRSLSPSRALMFKKCPQQYKFRAVDKIPEESSDAQAVGNLTHKILEALMQQSASERTPQMGEKLWAGLILKQDEPWSSLGSTGMETALGMVQNYFEVEDPTRVRPSKLEWWVELDVGGLNLRGVIDRLDEDGTIVDYKTGRAPSERYEQGAFFGLRFYAALCKHAAGFVPREVRLLYLKTKEVLSLKPEPDLLTGFERQILAIDKAIQRAAERNDWRTRPGTLCKWCSYVDRCPAWKDQVIPWKT